RALKPGMRVFAAEVETAAPLAASLTAGEPVDIPFTPSFVDGIGAPRVFPAMWDLARGLLAGSLVSSPAAIAGAVRLLAERVHIVAEGAGAAPVAAALAGGVRGRVVCVISGGCIDAGK